jgi:hypothetical protein
VVLVLIWARILLDLQSPAFIKFNRSNYFVIFEVKLPVEYLSKKATSLRMTDWKKWFLSWKKKNLMTRLKKISSMIGWCYREDENKVLKITKKNGFLRFVNVCNKNSDIAAIELPNMVLPYSIYLSLAGYRPTQAAQIAASECDQAKYNIINNVPCYCVVQIFWWRNKALKKKQKVWKQVWPKFSFNSRANTNHLTLVIFVLTTCCFLFSYVKSAPMMLPINTKIIGKIPPAASENNVPKPISTLSKLSEYRNC